MSLNADQVFAVRLENAMVLVVDDFDSMRKVTANQLRQLGVQRIIEAPNGAEALKLLARHPVTLVLSDWNMPVMSGLDFLLAVRSSPKLFALPFIMITADAERERIIQAAHVGVSELLVKPYTAGKLIERIERAFKWRPRINGPIDPVATMAALGFTVKVSGKLAATQDAVLDLPLPVAAGVGDSVEAADWAISPKARSDEKPTILVVDDTPDNLMLLSQIFKAEYRVKIAHNGLKALSICQSDSPPDLVLLDVMMPGMDGFEVAKALRSHPSSEQIPVIFVTALTDEASRVKGMELGAVDFVTKPVNPDLLKVRVRNFMRYIELQRNLQADYDNILQMTHLQEQVQQISRHDLKGPLASVLGLAQGLVDADNLTNQQREQLKMIEEVAESALNMISRSSDLYKIETGQFVLKPELVFPARILRRQVAQMRKTFAAKSLIIGIGTPHGYTDEELPARGDATLLYSAFQNLLKNACEAAVENSEVTVALWNEQPMRIQIENSGLVPAEIREHFFEKYVTCGKAEGSGLGTYSAKLLIEAQGGSIAMEADEAKQRTRITLTLPTN